jgi:glycosyltransferase involved in cell wall biosynthesis
MLNLAIIASIDFEDWNTDRTNSMGGIAGAIKNILPYIVGDKIFLVGSTSNKKKLYKEIHLKNNISILPIVYIPRNTFIPDRLFVFWYSRNINNILKNYNVNSVYSHSFEMSYWIKLGFNIIEHMHGSTNALNLAKNKFFRLGIFQYCWEHIRKKCLRKATKIIAIDPLCFEISIKLKKENSTILLPNFIDTKVFYRDDTPCERLNTIQEKILLFVGRIEEVKGLELFVDTLIDLDKKEKGQWKGVIVGRGTYEATIRKYIIEKSALNLFFFPGAIINQADLRKIYNRASMFMISSFHEGIPMVILESLACGTPVISTNVGGIEELISDNKMCFVINNRDPIEFSNLILSVKKNKNSILEDEFRFSVQEASLIINSALSSSN